MAQKKVGFSRTGSVQADRLIINNGLTASTTYNFYGLTAISFNLPVVDGTNGQALKTDGNGNLSFGTVAVSSTSGTSGQTGTSGTSGQTGTSGSSGANGSSGSSGQSGTSGTSGLTGTSGTSGVNGVAGTSGTSGQTGTSGTSGVNGTSGTSGQNGTSGTSGVNGTSGTSGVNGTSGTSGVNGTSGSSGQSGSSGTSGANGVGGATILGTVNYIPKFTGATALGNSNIIENGTQILSFLDGSPSSPAFSFNSDSDNGIYKPATNQVGIASGGGLRLLVGISQTQVSNTLVAQSNFIANDGSVSTPSVSFTSDTDTGIFRPSANNLAITAGGATTAVFGLTNSIANRTYFEKAVNHYPVVNASVSGTYSIDMSLSNVFNLTLTGNTTLDYTNSSEGSYILLVKQDGTGGRTLGFASGGKFIGATAVSIGTASNVNSVIQLIHIGTQSIVTYQTNLVNL